jgi:hypothetical protein
MAVASCLGQCGAVLTNGLHCGLLGTYRMITCG